MNVKIMVYGMDGSDKSPAPKLNIFDFQQKPELM